MGQPSLAVGGLGQSQVRHRVVLFESLRGAHLAFSLLIVFVPPVSALGNVVHLIPEGHVGSGQPRGPCRRAPPPSPPLPGPEGVTPPGGALCVMLVCVCLLPCMYPICCVWVLMVSYLPFTPGTSHFEMSLSYVVAPENMS